jgi:hypothetical protein
MAVEGVNRHQDVAIEFMNDADAAMVFKSCFDRVL